MAASNPQSLNNVRPTKHTAARSETGLFISSPMSCLRLRLSPAKKAWNIITSKLHIKLIHKLHTPKSVYEQRSRALSLRRPRRQMFKKRRAPVYVDNLFREPVQDHLVLCSKHVSKFCTTTARTEKLAVESDASTNNYFYEGRVNDEQNDSAADDMWEAVGLESPLMHGIDDRAEEFIAKFRAEMKLQESIARNL